MTTQLPWWRVREGAWPDPVTATPLQVPLARLDFVFEIVCPWSHLAWIRLLRVLNAHPDPPVALHVHPLELTMTVPRGVPFTTFCRWRFGNEERVRTVLEAAREAARQLGLRVNYERLGRVPATRDCHRLVQRAARQGRALPLITLMFNAFFVEGRDLGARETLVALGLAAGLGSRESLRAWLASDEGTAALIQDRHFARDHGITAVPTMLINQRFTLTGAQEEAVIQRLLQLGHNTAPSADRDPL